MFGFSLAELLLVCIIALIFIRPKDLPEIAHFIGKIFYRGKAFFADLKKQFKEVEQERVPRRSNLATTKKDLLYGIYVCSRAMYWPI